MSQSVHKKILWVPNIRNYDKSICLKSRSKLYQVNRGAKLAVAWAALGLMGDNAEY